jgi:hypothetical protein
MCLNFPVLSRFSPALTLKLQKLPAESFAPARASWREAGMEK